MKRMKTLTACTLLLVLSSPSWGQGGHRFGPERGRHGGDWWNHPEVQKRLSLSDEQVSQIGAFHLENHKKMIGIKAKSEVTRLDLHSLAEQKEVDVKAIDEKINELGELHKERLRTMIGQKLSLRDVLNDSQLKQVQQFMDRREKGRRGHPGRDGRGFRGPRGEGGGPGFRGRGPGPGGPRHGGPGFHRGGPPPHGGPGFHQDGFGGGPPPPRYGDDYAGGEAGSGTSMDPGIGEPLEEEIGEY